MDHMFYAALHVLDRHVLDELADKLGLLAGGPEPMRHSPGGHKPAEHDKRIKRLVDALVPASPSGNSNESPLIDSAKREFPQRTREIFGQKRKS